ncbi:MAG: M3 family metallopeptidase, partial [Nodosilinea sp.]
MKTSTLIENPLLIGEGLPPFDRLEDSHIVPGITTLLQELTADLEALESHVSPTWSGLVNPLTRIRERLSWSWGIISHLMGVKNSPELRAAYEAVQPALIEFETRLDQSEPIYAAFKAMRHGSQWPQLEPAQQRIVESALQQAELAGIGLQGSSRDRFNQIQQTLAELSTQFSNNVLDATKAFRLTLTTAAEIEGLPPSLLALAAQNARQYSYANATAATGPWVITLDYPSFTPFMQHSRRRDLRQQLYLAFITRAANGDLDNAPLMHRILELRYEMTELLGYGSYAELSLARKMAPSVEAIYTLMEELRVASYDTATEELQQLSAFARQKGAPEAEHLTYWDTAFWAERIREEKYGL